ncbi:MAG: DegQ family serine endoprotease [Rhodospirillales bacterium]|nr:DegQ family serine endoprotease [Rhodospirillales bacterium]
MQHSGVGGHFLRRGRATILSFALFGAIAAVPLACPLPAYALTSPESFADLIDQVAPAVVQITAKQPAGNDETAQAPFQLPDELRNGPFRDFFEHHFGPGNGEGGESTPQGERAALGSGFIISGDGVIVTNNHVIGDAQKIAVTLKDGSEFPAKLLGSDEKTDLAVLKIDAGRTLPSVSWGNSDATRVGDWVVAVGNPFGLTGTVTAGIVSSRGRDLHAGPYDDFIQIDAPLNSGNSGGPLFDAAAHVIGVNTAIFTPNGGSIGIGFAIPSNIAEKIVAELQDKGSVERGWLGVAIQPVTPDVADSLALKKAEGALVATVTDDSPAKKAGLKQGDVIIGFDGKPVATPRDLSRMVAETTTGSEKSLTVWRDGHEKRINVDVGSMPKQVAENEPSHSGHGATPGGVELSALGLTLAPVDDATRSHYGLSQTANGAVIASVDANADAAEKGLRAGDVITRVNQQAVTSPSDVLEAVAKAKGAHRKSVLLLVERQGDQRFVAVTLATA